MAKPGNVQILWFKSLKRFNLAPVAADWTGADEAR